MARWNRRLGACQSFGRKRAGLFEARGVEPLLCTRGPITFSVLIDFWRLVLVERREATPQG